MGMFYINRIIILSFLLLCSISSLYAQKTKTVETDYTYYAEENVSPAQAKMISLARAQQKAVAEAFGTMVTRNNVTRIENNNGKSDIKMLSMGGSEAKGEWIETIGEPVITIGAIEKGMYPVTVHIKGKVREILDAAIDVNVKILCNGTSDKFENSHLRSGNALYVSFETPIDGFVTIYLLDAEGDAFRMLPYQKQNVGAYSVKSGQRYVFFDKGSVPPAQFNETDEYFMTCNGTSELNFLYVIFSPKTFTKALDKKGEKNDKYELPPTLSFADFQKWLAVCRKHDLSMVVKMFPIEIEK